MLPLFGPPLGSGGGTGGGEDQGLAAERAWWSEAILSQVQVMLEGQTRQLQSSLAGEVRSGGEEQSRQLQRAVEREFRWGAEEQTRQLQRSFAEAVQSGAEEQTRQLQRSFAEAVQSGSEEQTRQLRGCIAEEVRRIAETLPGCFDAAAAGQLRGSLANEAGRGAEEKQGSLAKEARSSAAEAQQPDQPPGSQQQRVRSAAQRAGSAAPAAQRPAQAPPRRAADESGPESQAEAAAPLLKRGGGKALATPTAKASAPGSASSPLKMMGTQRGLLSRQSTGGSWEEMIAGPTSELDQGNGCMTSIARHLDEVSAIREGPRTGWLASAVQGAWFQSFFTCVIGANVIYMIINVDNDMERLSKSKPMHRHPKIDTCFLVLYLVELCCKLAVHRLFYFWNDDMGWNIMDFMLVMYSVIDMAFASQAPGHGAKGGATWLRMIRIFRIAKVLRILKFVQAFKQLQVIVSALVQSVFSIFWSLMVFAMISMLFSLYFVSAAASYLETGVEDAEFLEDSSVQDLLREFGSVQQCVLVLFMTLTGGDDWGEFHTILRPVGAASTVFIFYVCVGQLALLNIITGIFVENGLKLSEPEPTQRAEEQRMRDNELARALHKLFLAVDHDGDGLLNKAEFQEMLESGRLASFLTYLGIDPEWSETNLPMLFDRIVEEAGITPDRDGVTWVDPSTLVETCMSLRGHARSTEVMDLREMILQIQAKQELMCDRLGVFSSKGHSPIGVRE